MMLNNNIKVIGDEADLPHAMGPNGTQNYEMEGLRKQIAALTLKVKHLQPPCERIQIPDFCGDESEFDDWL